MEEIKQQARAEKALATGVHNLAARLALELSTLEERVAEAHVEQALWASLSETPDGDRYVGPFQRWRQRLEAALGGPVVASELVHVAFRRLRALAGE